MLAYVLVLIRNYLSDSNFWICPNCKSFSHQSNFLFLRTSGCDSILALIYMQGTSPSQYFPSPPFSLQIPIFHHLTPILSSQVHNFTYIFLSKIILKSILECHRYFLAHTCFSFLSLGVYTPFTYFSPYVVIILPSFSPNITPALSVYFLFYFTQPITSFSLYFAFLTPPLIDMFHQFPTVFASIY